MFAAAGAPYDEEVATSSMRCILHTAQTRATAPVSVAAAASTYLYCILNMSCIALHSLLSQARSYDGVTTSSMLG
jgi:hypothetical protein